MYKTFKDLPKIAQVLLLLIPVVSFFTELLVRIDLYNKDKSTGSLVMLILSIISCGFVGLVDIILIIVKGDILKLDIK